MLGLFPVQCCTSPYSGGRWREASRQHFQLLSSQGKIRNLGNNECLRCYWNLKNGWAKSRWVPITSPLSILCYEVQITRYWMHLRESVMVVLLRDWSRRCCVIARDPVSFCPAACLLPARPRDMGPLPQAPGGSTPSRGHGSLQDLPLSLGTRSLSCLTPYNASLISPQEYLEWSKYIKPPIIQPVCWFQLTSEFVETER